ncbi:MYXO-CTERM sorting domain-containing protein [Akkermansia sp.]
MGLSHLALHGAAEPDPAPASLGLLGLAALLLRRRV